jgi:hypothetical protein
VQLDCSLAALQADSLFTHVNTCSVYSLEALQANFEDPFLEPPTTGGVHDTRDVTWMHRMFFERQVSHGIVIPPMIIQGIDETPTRSGEGINDNAVDEETEDGINVETVIEDDDETDAESELPMEGDANVMGNPTSPIEGVNQTRSGRTIKPPERLIQEIGAFTAQGATAAANYEIALTAAEIQYYNTMKGLG